MRARWKVCHALCLLIFFGGQVLPAQTAMEYEVKAAYLYNFAKFVTWPGGDSSSALTVCVMGKDPFGQVLDDAVRSKSVHGRPIAVRRISHGGGPQGCQIVFAGFGEGVCRDLLARFDWDGILLVGEGDQFVRCGGMIGLALKDERVQFEINTEALAKAHLEVSSKLLQLASIVTTTKQK